MWILIGIWSCPRWQPCVSFFQRSVICFNYRRAGTRRGNGTVHPSIAGSTGPTKPSWYEGGRCQQRWGGPLPSFCSSELRGNVGARGALRVVVFDVVRFFILAAVICWTFSLALSRSARSFGYGMIFYIFIIRFYFAFLCFNVE